MEGRGQKQVGQREKLNHDAMTQAPMTASTNPMEFWEAKISQWSFLDVQTFILLHQPAIEWSRTGSAQPWTRQVPSICVNSPLYSGPSLETTAQQSTLEVSSPSVPVSEIICVISSWC